MLAIFLIIFLLPLLSSSAPVVLRADALTSLTPENILQIAPDSKSCDGAPFADECATADYAATMMSFSFKDFDATSPGELTALVSLIAYESGDFKYNHKHFPPTPGSGTRNMQSIEFNLQYAAMFPTLQDKLSAITGGQQTVGGDVADKVLQLLIDERLDFGSAAWYLGAKCPDVKAQLKQGFTVAAWEGYITQCIRGTMDEKRKVYMQKAAEVFGMKL